MVTRIDDGPAEHTSPPKLPAASHCRRLQRCSRGLDLAVVTLEAPHADALALARMEPVLGDQVSVLGYPGGGSFAASRGRMIELVDGARYGVNGRLAVSDAHVEPGNSGGPVINSHGEVVGVLSAIEFRDGYAMVVPLDELKAALNEPMQESETSCNWVP